MKLEPSDLISDLNVIGVVLAGGRSSRMHQDKSDLLFNNKSLLEHTQQLLTDAGCSEVLVSKNQHSDYIPDRYENSGPLSGIEACLNFILSRHKCKLKNSQDIKQADFILIMPVDMPLMTKSLLNALMGKAEQGNAVFYSLGRFPLMLPVSESLSKKLIELLEFAQQGRGVSIKHLLSHIPNQTISIDEDQHRAFYNCNTPEQWRNLLET